LCAANLRIWPSSIKKEGKIVNTFSLGGDRISAVTTNEQGIASFGWIPVECKDGMLIEIRHDDYYYPEIVFTKPGDKGELTARLVRKVRVSGRVTFADGKPAGGILIQAEGRGGTRHRYSAQARTRPDTQDRPVAGATVQVKCDTDSGHYEFIAVADSAGRFTVRGWQGKIRFEVRGRDGQIGRSEVTENDRTVKIVTGIPGQDMPATSIENLKHIAFAFHQHYEKQK